MRGMRECFILYGQLGISIALSVKPVKPIFVVAKTKSPVLQKDDIHGL